MDNKILNEFRQDLVSGDWVLFATGRARKPSDFVSENNNKASTKSCPFDDPVKSGQEIIWRYPDNKSWEVMVIRNKFPAVKFGACGPSRYTGPFKIHDALGIHDVIIFKDHNISLSEFTVDQCVNLVRAYKKRYQEIADEKTCGEFIMIFHNYGSGAGASISHPHSQIISTPILPPDVSSSLYGALKFYQENKKRVYDLIMRWEREEKKRIVYENDIFIALCPFVSRLPYEVRIFPKDSHSHFERMPDDFDKYFADVLLTVLKKIKKALGDPSYNFFIHTAPLETSVQNIHEFYSWHVEILPKLSISAGFELGTGIDVNVIDPDKAAEELRNA